VPLVNLEPHRGQIRNFSLFDRFLSILEFLPILKPIKYIIIIKRIENSNIKIISFIYYLVFKI